MRLRRSIMSIVVLSLAAAACSSSATPTPSPTAVPSATEAASAPTASASEAASQSEAAASPSAAASGLPSSFPPSFPPTTTFTFRGTKTANSKPFTMAPPARVSWSFSGSGAFSATIVPTGGVNTTSTGTIASTSGRGSGDTWIYGSSAEFTINVTGTGAYSITVMSPVAPTILPMPANFSGTFGTTTQPFAATGDITIAYATQGGGPFDISLIDAVTGFSVVDAAGGTGPTTSTAVVHDLSGTYAFDVTASGAWTVSVKGP
jgi:hypothetical protein